MRRYLSIYKSLLKINMVAMTTYRANFLNSAISALVWSAFVIGQMVIIFNKTGSVFGWSKEHLILLTVIYGLITAIFHMVFARGFERFAKLMTFGNFDAALLKPVDSQFNLSFWEVNYAQSVRLILIGALLFYLLNKLSFQFDIISFALFLSLILAGVLILYSFWVVAMSFIIRVPELTNILEIMYSFNGMSRFPPQMYNVISPVLYIAVLPLVLAASVPLKALFGEIDIMDILTVLIFCIVSLLASRFIWLRTLRAYSSASN